MVGFIRDPRALVRPDPAAKRIPAADYQVWLDAQGLLEAANAEASAIQARATEAYEQERLRGYAEGSAQAREEAAERMIENVGRTVEYYAKVESRMVDLVTQSLRRIIGEFDDRQRVVTVVRNALSTVRNQKQVTLRVAPDRLDMVKQATNEILAAYPGIGYLDLTPDSRLSDDQCILETEIGIVEASIEGQIAAIARAFAKILGSRA